MKYDLIVKGGLLIDPSQGIKQHRDVAVLGSKVANIEDDIDPQRAKNVLDASDKIVTPGLIDFHTHVYYRVGRSSVDPDVNCLSKGVTTVVDAGTSGALNYHGFKKYVIEACRTRVLAFLHISDVGLTMGESIGELEDMRHLDFDRAVNVAVENRDVIKGIKIRVPEDVVGIHGPQCLRLAKEVARTVDMPLMVHPGNLPSNLLLKDVLGVLETGDIMTHCYPPPYPPRLSRASIFNEDGGLIPEVWGAKERGVLFDVAHGRNNFCWETAELALNQIFLPTTISSDLTLNTVNICVHNLPTVLSKFIHLGLPLYDVIERCTLAPASLLGMNDRIGTLKIGAEADIAIFDIEDGEFPLWDNIRPCKERRIIKSLLKPVGVVKGGKTV